MKKHLAIFQNPDRCKNPVKNDGSDRYLTDLEKATLLRHRAGVLLKESRELLHEAEAIERRCKYLTGEEVEKNLRPMLRITHHEHGAKAEVYHG